MAQYFQLQLKTNAPQGGAITPLSYYKDNSTPITLNVTNATYMKVWIDQTADTSTPPTSLAWKAYSNSWTPNFSVEGTNYIHAVFADNVGNESAVVHSTGVIFDKTAPVISSVIINNDDDITSFKEVTIRVTASDTPTGSSTITSGVGSVTFSGDLDPSSTVVFTWGEADRERGYKDCVIKLSSNAEGVTSQTKTVRAIASDRAGNSSEQKSDNIVFYSGGIDPVLVLKDKDNSKVLGYYNNEQELTITLQMLTGEPSMCAGYKIWGDFSTTGGSAGTDEPTDYTPWGDEKINVITGMKFTQAEGTKTVNAKAKLIIQEYDTFEDLPDASSQALGLVAKVLDGNKYYVVTEGTEGRTWVEDTTTTYGQYQERTLTPSVIVFSDVEPVIAITTDKATISDKTGHNISNVSAEFTTTYNCNEYKLVAYDTLANAQAGTRFDASNINCYGTTETKEWTGEVHEDKLVLAVPNEGQKFIVCYARNLCNNWGKSNVLVLNVDVTAPVGSLTVNAFYKEASGFTSSATDAGSSVAKMKAWVDGSAGTEIAPDGTTEYDYAPNFTQAQVNWTNVAEGTCYLHAIFTDEVGNSGVTHSTAFIYDTTAPTACSIMFDEAYTNTTTVVIHASASDVLSGMDKMKFYGAISGALTPEAAEWVDYSTSANIILSNGDGDKVIYALFRDKAGNVITSAVQATIKLDTTAPAATLALFNSADTQALGTYTNIADFTAHVGATEITTESNSTNIKEYKIWGDIVGATTEEGATWKTFTAETGKTYMSVKNLSLTSEEGLKTIHVKVKDIAGNISAMATATVTYDLTLPIVDVNNVDYNIISKQHTPRLTASGEAIADTFNDKMTFTFSSDSYIKEWKVCVNDTGLTPASAVAIGTTGGSVNMTGTNVEANTPVNCCIMGADFAATTKVNNTDNTYEVIVFVKDEAGNWSEIHAI